MSLESALHARSHSNCELCNSQGDLNPYIVSPRSGTQVSDCILICPTCQQYIEQPETADTNHWRCLNDSMWNSEPAVQVMAWRILNSITDKGWPQALLDMLYLEEDVLAWAQSDINSNDETVLRHLDVNGVALAEGDTVTLTKDLVVKGAGFTAKRGTAVRNIALVADNETQIEGRVNGQRIVLLTKFVKKSR